MGSKGADLGLAYVAETTAGTLPATPTMKRTRFTSETFSLTKNLIVNSEIDSSGIKNFDKHGSRSTSGALGFNLSYATFDDFFEGVFRNDYSTPIAVSGTLSVDSANSRVTGDDFETAGVLVGDAVRLEGFTNAENNIDAIVTAVTTTYIDVDATGMVTETGGGDESVTTAAKLIVSTSDKSFSFEKADTVDVTESSYQLYKGQHVGSVNLSLAQAGDVSGTLNFVGMGYENATTQYANSYTATDTNPLFDTVTAEGYLSIDDSVAGCVQSFDITIDNAYATRGCLFNPDPKSVDRGQNAVTGTLVVDFNNKTLIDAFVNETIGDIKVKLEDADGNAYYVWLPQVKYNGADNPTNAPTARTISLPFQAGYYTAQGNTTIIWQKLDARV